MLPITVVLAATDTWTGGGGDDIFWHTADNWGGTAPVQGDFLVFTGASSLTASNNYPAATYFAGVTFQSPAGAFVLQGRPFATTNISDQQAITAQTITAPLIASNTITVDMAADSVLNLNGEVRSPVGTTSGMTVTGNGTVNLNYDSTSQSTNIFTGTLEVDGGTIVPASDLSLGTTNDLTSPQAGRLVLNGGTLEAAGGTMTNINVNRGIAIGPTSGAGWGGIKVDTGRTLTYGGVVANNGGTGGLLKSGYGILAFSGQNSYTGPTTNSIGTLLLDFTQPGSPTTEIINSSSSLVMGGGNAGGGQENVAQLVMNGGTTANTQDFASTFATFGGSVIIASNAPGGSVQLNLNGLSHEPGGALYFQTPEASGGGHIATTSPNVNGILGGWALISGDGNGASSFADSGHTLITGTNFATVAGGNIVNFTGYSNVTSAATIASQVAGSPEPPNISINDTAGATVVNVDTDNAGTTNDINAILWTTYSGGFDSISIGTNNTLRLGQYGGIIRNGPSTGNAVYIGGGNSTVQSGSGISGVGDVGTLTAGGPNNDTAGEIVIVANNPSESTGTTIFESKITDNGSGAVTVVKMGPGSIKIDGHNTFSGGLYLLQGRVQFAGSEINNSNLVDSVWINGNPDAGGSGDIFVLPGAYLFPSGTGGQSITNSVFIAGEGDAHEHLGAIRGGDYTGTITLIGDAQIGSANCYGPITGPFQLGLCMPATTHSDVRLYNPDNDWTGNTIMNAEDHSGTIIQHVYSETNEVIPNGFGHGNVTMEPGGGRSTSYIVWDLNGFNETINGLSTSGNHEEDCIITNSFGGGTNNVDSTLTVGDNDQSGSFDGIIRDGGAGFSLLSLIKIGAGVETLTRANDYSGTTTISNGVLRLTGSGSINNSPNVNIEGGTFDVSGVSYTIPTGQSVNADGGAFKISSASSASGGSLNLTNGTLEVATASLTASYNGALSLGGVANTIHVDNFPKEGDWPHTFPIVTYTSLTGDPNTLTGQFPSAAYQGYFSNDVASSTIYVVITNGPITVSVVWGGSQNGDWDIQTTPNFEFASVHTNYFDGDIVTFPDPNVGSQYTVNLLDDFSPGGLTVSNDVGHTYTFDGTGSINGTNQVVKDGPGTWIIDNSADNNGGINGLSGGISIVAGTIQVGNNDLNGNLGPSANAVGDNGALVFARSDAYEVGNTISGPGSVTVTNGTLTLSGANSFGGAVEVQAGATLVAGNNSALGSTNSGTTIDDGATLDVSGGGLGANALNLGAEPVSVTGAGVGGNGAIVNSGLNNQQNALQQVVLNGNTTVGGATRWDIRGAGAGLSTGGNAYNLTKIGAGQLSIVGATVDPALGDVDIQGGILSLETTTTGIGNVDSNLVVESGATLQVYSLTNQLDKNITLNGDGTAVTLNGGGASTVDTIIGPTTLSGSVIVNGDNNNTLTLSNAISGDGSLTKTGTNSTLVLTGPGKTYTGGTVVNDGTLLINGINSGSQLTENTSQLLPGTATVMVGGNGTNAAPVDIEDTLWPGLAGSPATFGAGDGSSQYNGDGGAFVMGYTGGGIPKVIFSLGSSTTAGSGVNDLVTVNGDFNGNFSGHVLINPLAPLDTANPYTLVTYTGSKLGNFNSSVAVVDADQPSRYAFSLDYSTAHKVLLNVTTGAGSLVWNNAASTGIWDINNAANWFNTGSSANDVFLQLDAVTLDDSIGSGQTTITIATNVIPGTITVNSATNYILTGTGKITGSASIVKQGTSTLTISNLNNDFTGTTLIEGGTVMVSSGNSLGSLSGGAVTISDGATLDLGGSTTVNNINFGNGTDAKQFIVSGWGVNSNGAIINSSAVQQLNSLQYVTMAGDTAFGGPGFAQMPNNPGRWDIRGSGTITPVLSTGGNAYNLYKVGQSQFSLVGTEVDTNLADIHVYGGEFGVETTTSPTLGNPDNTITMDTGTSFEMFNFAGPLNKNMVVFGGQMLNDSNRPNIWFNSGSYPSNTIASTVVVTNGLVAIGGAGTGTFSNVISGNGSVFIVGSGTTGPGGATFVAANTYSGNTIISNNATLSLVDSASIDASPTITLGGGAATLDASGRTDFTLTLASSQTLNGGGTVNGSLSSPSGTTVSVGIDTNLAVLTVTTNADLEGSTYIKLDPANNTNDVVAAANLLTIGGTLNVTNISDFTLGAGQSQVFKVLNAPTYVDNSVSVQLPTIAGISWDTTQLAVNGTITANSTLTPTPVITSISLSGTTLTINATNGPASGSYALLESTNVALPLSQWTPLFTNSFDGSGDIINLSTNVVDPNLPQTFYILQVAP